MTGSTKLCFALLIALVLGSSLMAEEKATTELQSGPKVGERAVPYHPLLCNGSTIGQRWCMVCTNRSRGKAMVIIFAREQTDSVTNLITSVEAMTKKQKKLAGIFTFLTTQGKTAQEAETLTGEKVVYLNDAEEKAYASIRKLAASAKIENSSLNIYTADGPAGYKLSPEAAVTILVADASTEVKANIALKKEELTKERLKQVTSEIKKALSL